MKKKILFLSPLPPPDYGSALSSKSCLEILKSDKNFEVRNIKLNYSMKMDDVGKINLDKIKGFYKVMTQIKKVLKSFKPDLVYFVPATGGLGLIRDYLFFRAIRKKYSGKFIFHIRSRITKEDAARHKRIYEMMFSDSKIIVLGKELISDVNRFSKEENISVLPNTIKDFVSEKDFIKIQNARKKRKVLNILFLSNMDKSKGWMKVLESCRILSEKNTPFVCNFVGGWQDNEDSEYFIKFVRKNKLSDKVFYLGSKNGDEKIKVLKNSDILIFPTEYKFETFGRVIIEGMCAGLPVIANSIAAIPSIIIDRKTGFLLKENSPKEISKYILELAENKNLRLKMGREGRKRFLEYYSLKDFSRRFVKLINSV